MVHTDSAVLPDSEGSHGDTGCLLPVTSGRRGVLGEGEMQWVTSSLLGAPSCGSPCSKLTKRRQILVLSPTCGPEHMLPAASPCCYFETGSCYVAPADLDHMAILLSQLSWC